MFDAMFDAGDAFLLPETVCREHLGWAYVDGRGCIFDTMIGKRGFMPDAPNGSGVHL